MSKLKIEIPCVLLDIDGCYSYDKDWLKYLPKENTREAWDEFHTYQYLSKPNKRLINKIVAISKNTPILFITAREDRNDMRAKTIREIESFSGDMIKIGLFHKLFMRKDCDYRPSAVMKEEILLNDILPNGYVPMIAVDDDISNIEMYEKHNILTKHYCIKERGVKV